jgi:hypothetical protein
MDTGELLTRWSARIALVLYVASLATRGMPAGNHGWLSSSRCLWSAGCGVYLLHVACAFQFIHHWSHSAAFASTARQTAELTGVDWGGGILFNYLFTLIWLADVGWWWLNRESYEARSRFIDWPVQAFLAFIAFNATVVFATGATRWAGVAGTVMLVAIAGRSLFKSGHKLEG